MENQQAFPRLLARAYFTIYQLRGWEIGRAIGRKGEEQRGAKFPETPKLQSVTVQLFLSNSRGTSLVQ